MALADRYRLPAMYGARVFLDEGGLIGYSPNDAQQYFLLTSMTSALAVPAAGAHRATQSARPSRAAAGKLSLVEASGR